MAPPKRSSADMLDEEDEEFIDATTGEATGSRKRRKTSDETSLADEDADSDHPADDRESTPASSLSSEDDELFEQLATQAVREKYAVGRENTPAENGILEEVYVINFMCHSNFVFKLSPLINFICGKNGSGKSAILTAITLCLGGKASSTNRGQSLKDFIKEGRDSARILVKIKNQGLDAYMPEEYGQSIIVERHFNRSGASGFKIQSEKGRVISTKKADLDDICDHFSLQIENPLNVLSQDMARQFITGATPTEKYKFFMKGVQLEQLDQDYRIIEDTLDNIEVRIDNKKPDVEILKERSNKAEEKDKLSRKHDGLRDKIRDTRRQVAWAQIMEQEKILDEYNEEVDQATTKIEDFESQIARLDAAYDQADQAAIAATEGFQQADAEVRKVEDEKKEAKVLFDEIKKAVSDAQTDQRTIRSALNDARSRIDAKTREIQEEEQRLADLNGGGAGERLRSLQQAKGATINAHQSLEDHQNQKAGLEREVFNAKLNVEEHQQHTQLKARELDDAQRKLSDLSRSRNNQDQAYHHNLPNLLRAIHEEPRFTDRPIGPLGKHVRLLKPQWSSVLEKSFGGTLNSFIVTSKSDMDILSGIMRRVQCSQNIIIGNKRQLDTADHEPDQRHDTILRALEIDNDLVRKQLIIQHGIEQSLLIEDLHQASDILYGPNRPSNVKRCFCIDPSQKTRGFLLSYTRTGHASQDPVHAYDGRPRMKTDDEAQLRLQRETVQEIRAQLRQAEDDFRMARDNSERAKQAVVRHVRQERDLRVAFQRAEDEVERLTEAIKEDSIENGKLEVLRSARIEAEEALTINESSYEDAVNALDSKAAELHTARVGLDAMDKRIAELQAIAKRVGAVAQQATKHRAKALHDKNNAVAKIDDAKDDRQGLIRKRDELLEKIRNWTEEARKVSERVDVPAGETVKSLQKRYDKLFADYNRYQQQIGPSREQIAADAARTSTAYREALEQVRDLEKLGYKLKGSLVERRARWKYFRNIISYRAKSEFTRLLSERSFRGKLITRHKRAILELNVEPDITKRDGAGRGTRTLSGGEKSYSQICLLLAIWEAMGSPIRCLDEFDVFMDAVNRNQSVRLLIAAARLSTGCQFVFISPGSKSDIPTSKGVEAQELPEPTRNQMTIEESMT